MKIIYIFLLLNTFIYAQYIDNPHEVNIVGKNINSDVCKNCHLSFHGEYSGYLASIYTPSIGEYRTYLASLDDFAIDDIATAGHKSEELDQTYSNQLFLSSSKLCISCHDGITALAVNHQSSLQINIDSSHPISIDYIEGKAGLKDKNTKIINWNNASYISDILVNSKIECISCHSPHNKTYKNYLRSKNSGSKLCSTCHNQ